MNGRWTLLHTILLLVYALLFLMLLGSLHALSNPSPSWSASSPKRNESLSCSWTVSGDATAQQIDLLKNNVFINGSNESSGPFTTSWNFPGNTFLKGDNVTCRINVTNGTDSSLQEASVTIINSLPFLRGLPGGIFNQAGTDVGDIVQVTEDVTLLLDANASDNDPGETITYQATSPAYPTGFCTMTSSSLGTYSCTPRYADLVNNSPTSTNVVFSVLDGSLEGTIRTVTFNITPVNDAPTLTIPNQTTNVTATFNRTFTAADEESNYPLNVTLDASTDSEIADGLTVSVSSNNIVRVVYARNPPRFNETGNHTIVLNLSDTANGSTLVNFTLEITTVNRNPYFTNITPESYNSSTNHTYVIFQGAPLQINLSANDLDTEDRNETITFTSSGLFVVTQVNTTATNTSDARATIDFTPVNDDVGSQLVTITATDAGGLTNTTVLNITVQNVNDAPTIHNESWYTNNSAENVNITHLVAYLDAPFQYQVNFSDPDLDLGLDSLNWTENSSTISISADGLITGTPSGSPRNETVNITVMDSGGLSDSEEITLEILGNTAPVFLADPLPQLNASEAVAATYNVSTYATDNDAGDEVESYAVSFIGTTLGSLTLNATTGMITLTPSQSDVGNYTANITITDTRGASSSALFNITVNNTEDTPRWRVYNFTSQLIVEGHQFLFTLEADDEDLLLVNTTENLTITTNLSFLQIQTPVIADGNLTAILTFLPNSSQVGNWSVMLNVTDTTGLVATKNVSFTILARSQPPNFTGLRPYGNGTSNTIVDGWLSLANAATFAETVNLTENTSNLVFAVNATDDLTSSSALNYTWYYDGAIVQGPSNQPNYTRSFDFFSNGTHNVSVMVNDTMLETANASWNLVVRNVNRPPSFSNFTDTKLTITLAGSGLTRENYFINQTLNNGSPLGGFYDPDDDENGNGRIDYYPGNETLLLTHATGNYCSVANISISESSLTVTPVSVGSCSVQFTGTDDGGYGVTSNIVTIVVTSVPEGESVAVSSGGGGGGTTTITTTVPVTQEVETPQPLNIIAPNLVFYDNQTIVVPVRLESNWSEPLTGIVLSADSNVTGVEMSFETTFVSELLPNQTREVKLTVQGYRLGENFEVSVHANVTSPAFKDTALILFNTIEQSNEGDDVSLKVTFAQDLLSQNAQCQELNELLLKADEALGSGDIRQANELVDAAINGCKYLISKTQQDVQQPGVIRTPFFTISPELLRGLIYLGVAIAALLLSALAIYHHYSTKDDYDF